MALPDLFRTIVTSPQLAPGPALLPDSAAPLPVLQTSRIDAACRIPEIDLTNTEEDLVAAWMEPRLLLGPGYSSVMRCELTCPRVATCPLAACHKAPAGRPCPLEVHFGRERFIGWCKDLGANPDDLAETERVAAGVLAGIDIKEQRCLDIVAIGEDARLTQLSVKDVDIATGRAICWETVIHQNIQLLDQLRAQRRQILRDWELTPEMKSKRNRGIVKAVADLASRSADNSDKLRAAMKTRKIIDSQATQSH